MKTLEPCCTVFQTDIRVSWDAVRSDATEVPFVPQAPPQLIDGMVSLVDIGVTPPVTTGSVFTYVDASTSTWTEHWVVQPAGWFADATRHSRLKRVNPQPAAQPWTALAPTYTGWWHASVVFTYVAPPSSAPLLPVGTFVFDVRNSSSPAAPLRGRLFRTAVGTTIRDRWVLFSSYVAPQGNSITELHPKAGNAQTLMTEALTLGGSGAEYVDVTYTVAQL